MIKCNNCSSVFPVGRLKFDYERNEEICPVCNCADETENVPEPVKIEGVRELVEDIQRLHINSGVVGFLPKDTERLITDFIQQREAGKWVPVTERLPELDTVVITYTTNKWVIQMKYSSNEYARKPKPRFELNGSPGWSDTVTHWQPLPPAPQKF